MYRQRQVCLLQQSDLYPVVSWRKVKYAADFVQKRASLAAHNNPIHAISKSQSVSVLRSRYPVITSGTSSFTYSPGSAVNWPKKKRRQHKENLKLCTPKLCGGGVSHDMRPNNRAGIDRSAGSVRLARSRLGRASRKCSH